MTYMLYLVKEGFYSTSNSCQVEEKAIPKDAKGPDSIAINVRPWVGFGKPSQGVRSKVWTML